MIKGDEPGIGRAALGALIASLVKALLVWVAYRFVLQKEHWGYIDIDRATILMSIFGIPLALVVGVMVSIIVWMIKKRMGNGFGVIGRAVVGGVSVLALGIILLLLINRFSANDFLAFPVAMVFHTDLGVSVGVMAGILSESRKKNGVTDVPTA